MASESFDNQMDGSQEPHHLIRLLLEEGEKLSPKLRDKIISQKSAVVQPLIDLLNDEALHLEDAPGQGWAPIHAVALLGELKAEEAIQPMLRWLLETDASEDILHCQLITALGALGKAAYQPVLDAFEEADDDYKMSLCDVLVATGVKSDRIFNILLDYLHHRVDFGAMCFDAYGDPNAIPHLKQALADWEFEDAEQGFLFGQEVIELCGAIESLGGTLNDEEKTKRDQVLAYRRNLSDRLDSVLLTEEEDDITREVPVRNPHRKLGRNDPCWCGSGKKYKKCHWQSDQRELN